MKILFIDACVSIHPESRTRYLCDQYLRQLDSNGGTVERIELESLSIAPFSKATLGKREELIQKRQKKRSIPERKRNSGKNNPAISIIGVDR